VLGGDVQAVPDSDESNPVTPGSADGTYMRQKESPEMDPYCTSRTIGTSNKRRQMTAVALLALGAVACAATTLVGWPLYQTLLVLGGAATLAWLADGTSQRFMGPGLAAIAVGGGITAYKALDMEVSPGEHGIVYPALGAALLLASLFNPLAIRGAGTLLLIVGVVATVDAPWPSGWTLVGILAAWSALELARIGKGRGTDGELDQPAPTTAGSTSHERMPASVGASR
jgi:hypothetical protein